MWDFYRESSVSKTKMAGFLMTILSHLNGESTVEDFRANALEAEQEMFSGQHRTLILRLLARREIDE